MAYTHEHPNLGFWLHPVSSHADVIAPTTAGDYIIYWYSGDESLYAKAHDDSHAKVNAAGGTGDFMADGSVPMTGDFELEDNAILATEISTPGSNPAATKFLLYMKSDGKLYVLNSGGTESAVGAGSGGGLQVAVLTCSDGNTMSSGSSTVIPITSVSGNIASSFAVSGSDAEVQSGGAGDYMISAQVTVNNSNSGDLIGVLLISLNASVIVLGGMYSKAGGNNILIETPRVLVTLADSDVIELGLYQATGSTYQNISSGPQISQVLVEKLS